MFDKGRAVTFSAQKGEEEKEKTRPGPSHGNAQAQLGTWRWLGRLAGIVTLAGA
jgi:hypothetical protein